MQNNNNVIVLDPIPITNIEKLLLLKIANANIIVQYVYNLLCKIMSYIGQPLF